MALENLSYFVNSQAKNICVKDCSTNPAVYVPHIGLELIIDEGITTIEAVVWNLLRVSNPIQASSIAATAIGKAAYDAAIKPDLAVIARLGLDDTGDKGRGNIETKTALDSALSEQFTSYSQPCADCTQSANIGGTYGTTLGTAQITSIFVSGGTSDQQITEITAITFQLQASGSVYQKTTANITPSISASNPSGGVGGFNSTIVGCTGVDLSFNFNGDGSLASGSINGSDVNADVTRFVNAVRLFVNTVNCGSLEKSIF